MLRLLCNAATRSKFTANQTHSKQCPPLYQRGYTITSHLQRCQPQFDAQISRKIHLSHGSSTRRPFAVWRRISTVDRSSFAHIAQNLRKISSLLVEKTISVAKLLLHLYGNEILQNHNKQNVYNRWMRQRTISSACHAASIPLCSGTFSSVFDGTCSCRYRQAGTISPGDMSWHIITSCDKQSR